MRSLLIIAVTVDRLADGVRKIDKVKAHVVQGAGMVPQPQPDGLGSWFIELIDRQNRVVASHACRIPLATDGGCGCCGSAADIERVPRLDFVEALDWPEEITRIQLQRGEMQVASFDANGFCG